MLTDGYLVSSNKSIKKVILGLAAVLILATSLVASSFLSGKAAENPIPLLAYYYIWFDHPSWDRAKTDYPLLGRYSSDDREIMERHILWAKDAGINGFIVSWKRTERLNPRLEQLIELAESEDFKLVIIYQGLDFERDPLPVDQVLSDMQFFADRYAWSPAFALFEKPMVIWSGTWKFKSEEIAGVTAALRDRLLVLASERNVKGIERLESIVDGNAYYWSSVNPDTYPDYQGKLDDMSDVIHEGGGIWIAPAAPGFDARLVGGTRVVDRKNGATLLQQLATAFQSSPDAVGLISWNEFSENSHIEPSENYGVRYLELLSDFRQGSSIQVPNFSSDEPIEASTSIDNPADVWLLNASENRFFAVIVLVSFVLFSLGAIVYRSLFKHK